MSGLHHVYLYRYQIAWEEKKFNKSLALGNLGHKYGNNLQSQEGPTFNVACGGQQPQGSWTGILNPGILDWGPGILGSWTGILNPGILANALLRPTPAKALHRLCIGLLMHSWVIVMAC